MNEKENMKKLCLISLMKSDNYGANLQGFALYTFIKTQFPSVDVTVVDLLRPGQEGYIDPTTSKKRKIGWKQKIFSFLINLRHFNAERKRRNRFVRFYNGGGIFDKIKFTKTYHNAQELNADYPQCDIYITGSDQVWCPNRKFDMFPYLLSFVKHKAKKISYAPSMSTESLTDEQAEVFREALSKFDNISVRELSDKELLKSVIPDADITVTVDPVMLLKPEVWAKLCEPVLQQNYVLFYTIWNDEVLFRYAKAYSQRHNLKLCCIKPISRISQLFANDYYSIDDAGPRELLSWIKSATVVITNSYHGVLMSLNLKTPFFYRCNAFSSRFVTISSRYHLDHHQITDLDKDMDVLLAEVSDESLTLILQYSEESRRWLIDAINDNKTNEL